MILASPGRMAKNKTNPYNKGTAQLFLLNAPLEFAARVNEISLLENLIPAPAAMIKMSCQMNGFVPPI